MPALEEQFGGQIGVVLDYLWGQSAERIIVTRAKEGKAAVPIRFIQIGSISAEETTLPNAALRSSSTTVVGSGIGSVPLDRRGKSIGDLMKSTVRAGFEIETKTFPLSQVEHAWATSDSSRLSSRLEPTVQVAGMLKRRL